MLISATQYYDLEKKKLFLAGSIDLFSCYHDSKIIKNSSISITLKRHVEAKANSQIQYVSVKKTKQHINMQVFFQNTHSLTVHKVALSIWQIKCLSKVCGYLIRIINAMKVSHCIQLYLTIEHEDSGCCKRRLEPSEFILQWAIMHR